MRQLHMAGMEPDTEVYYNYRREVIKVPFRPPQRYP
jgi:hypothetical protein